MDYGSVITVLVEASNFVIQLLSNFKGSNF
jgi:hypothetical protein